MIRNISPEIGKIYAWEMVSKEKRKMHPGTISVNVIRLTTKMLTNKWVVESLQTGEIFEVFPSELFDIEACEKMLWFYKSGKEIGTLEESLAIIDDKIEHLTKIMKSITIRYNTEFDGDCIAIIPMQQTKVPGFSLNASSSIRADMRTEMINVLVATKHRIILLDELLLIGRAVDKCVIDDTRGMITYNGKQMESGRLFLEELGLISTTQK